MESFIGFVYPSAFNFAPRNYAFCAGQLLQISDFSALFALIGDTYGGDARTSMGVPDLRGRTPVGSSVMGTPLPPVSPIAWGQRGGAQEINLAVSQLPAHNHLATFTPSGGGSSSGALSVSTSDGNQDAAAGNYFANGKQGFNSVKGFVDPNNVGTTVDIGGLNVSGSGGDGTVVIDNTGNGASINIQNPYLGVNYVMALIGIFPSRN